MLVYSRLEEREVTNLSPLQNYTVCSTKVPSMTRYRIMIEGEDHTLFCYENDLDLEEIDKWLEEARENYPNANLMVESYDQVKTF